MCPGGEMVANTIRVTDNLNLHTRSGWLSLGILQRSPRANTRTLQSKTCGGAEISRATKHPAKMAQTTTYITLYPLLKSRHQLVHREAPKSSRVQMKFPLSMRIFSLYKKVQRFLGSLYS